MSETAAPLSQQVNVRVTQRDRAMLEELAAVSDRPVSRLVRYAIEAWVADPDREYPVLGRALSDVVRMRLDVGLLEVLDLVCDEAGVQRSMAIRCAVQAWLADGALDRHRAALGLPGGE